MSFLSFRSTEEQTRPRLVQSTFPQGEEVTHALNHKSSAQLIIREPAESKRKQTLINLVPRGKIRDRLWFLDNGSCKAHRGGAGQGEDAKIHYQPTLSGNPQHGLGKAPHCLFVKGCCSPPEYSLLKERVKNGQKGKRGPAWRPQAKDRLVPCTWPGANPGTSTGWGMNKDDAEENLMVLVDERLDMT